MKKYNTTSFFGFYSIHHKFFPHEGGIKLKSHWLPGRGTWQYIFFSNFYWHIFFYFFCVVFLLIFFFVCFNHLFHLPAHERQPNTKKFPVGHLNHHFEMHSRHGSDSKRDPIPSMARHGLWLVETICQRDRWPIRSQLGTSTKIRSGCHGNATQVCQEYMWLCLCIFILEICYYNIHPSYGIN